MNEPPKLRLSSMLLYSAASLGMGFFYAFSNFTLPLYLRNYTTSDALIGLLANTRSFEGALVQPVVGAWSDRIWTRLGRRTPFFLISMPLVALLILFLALEPAFGLVIAAVLLFTLLFNVGADPYIALQADIAPPEQRSTLNSLAMFLQAGGQLVFALASGMVLWAINPAFSFYLVAGGLVLTFGLTIAGVRERRRTVAIHEKLRFREHLTTLPRYQEALKFYGVQFLLWFGINAATPFLTLFATYEISGVDEGTAQLLAGLLLAVTAICAVPVGLLGDRYSRKVLLGIGLLLFGGGALAAALWARTVTHIVLVLVIIGVGNTAHTVLSYPLLTELVPPGRIGEFWGFNTFFASAAALVSAAFAGWLADLFGSYRAVFVLTGLCLLAATAALTLVHPERAGLQIQGE
jgi:maltose/moltooligosaccharide transporter